jgi:glc operon protein GlcG
VLATVSCLSVGAQIINVRTLDQAGAQMVLQAAKASAQQRHAPSAIAVVDPVGNLLAFERMDGVRPASADLAIGKARTAARLQRPTAEIEDNINQGRTAFVTANIAALRGGMPIRVGGEFVGAVGIAGLSKETDVDIANTAATALGPLPETARASLRCWREADIRKLPIKCPATDDKYCSGTKFSSNGLGIGLATDPC